MTRPRQLLVATVLLLAMVGAACSSQASVGSAPVGSDQAGSVPQQDETNSAPQAPATNDAQTTSVDTSPPVALDTAPIDYAAVSGGPVFSPTTPIPCHLSGPVVAAFAESREAPLTEVQGNVCRWSSGLHNTVQIVFKDVSSIDVVQERPLHGAYSTLVDEDGPGTDAASFRDDDGAVERFFFVQDERAVFLVAETKPTPTAAELRAMADEIAGLIGSAVDEGQRWFDYGESGDDPLCSVWDAEAIRQMFGATAVFPAASSGCTWTLEGPDNDAQQVTLDIDPYNSIETLIREGGSELPIGDSAAGLSQESGYGTARQVALVAGDAALIIKVESANHADLADTLAANLASRLG